MNCYNQDDKELIKLITENSQVLIPPPDEPVNRELINSNPNAFSEDNEDFFLDKMIFNNLKSGFFIEAGATDFIYHSTSLHFELNHEWSGLLVEPLPVFSDVGYTTPKDQKT